MAALLTSVSFAVLHNIRRMGRFNCGATSIVFENIKQKTQNIEIKLNKIQRQHAEPDARIEAFEG